METPEIPDPQNAPSEEGAGTAAQGQPGMNGNGGAPHGPEKLDNEKLIEWIKATDKEIKMLRIGQLVLGGAILMLLITSAKAAKVPTAV
jgi:hypothetical protein